MLLNSLDEVSNKNLSGRDGRTICGPQCVPKSTSVTLAVDEKTLPMATITGRTDRRTDRVRRNMRPPPREEGRIISRRIVRSFLFGLFRCRRVHAGSLLQELGSVTLVRELSLTNTSGWQLRLTVYDAVTRSARCRNNILLERMLRFAYDDALQLALELDASTAVKLQLKRNEQTIHYPITCALCRRSLSALCFAVLNVWYRWMNGTTYQHR